MSITYKHPAEAGVPIIVKRDGEPVGLIDERANGQFWFVSKHIKSAPQASILAVKKLIEGGQFSAQQG